MLTIAIDQDSCIQCGACAALCTSDVFNHTDDGVEVIAPQDCWLCGHCVAACPSDAVAHSAYPLSECPELDPANLPTLDKLVSAFRERRSLRVFSERPVPRQVVRELIDIARWVPSAGNDQPVDWLAFDDPDRIAALSAQAIAVYDQMVRKLRNRWLRPLLKLALGPADVKAGLENLEIFEDLVQRHAKGEDPIFRRAPVVLVTHVPGSDYFGRDDAAYATYNLMLAAQRLGLGTCQIGYFQIALGQSRQLRDALGLPDGRHAQIALTLGYPEHPFQRVIPRRQPDLVWNAPGVEV